MTEQDYIDKINLLETLNLPRLADSMLTAFANEYPGKVPNEAFTRRGLTVPTKPLSLREVPPRDATSGDERTEVVGYAT